jgi:predicted metal-dependent hydrolase
MAESRVVRVGSIGLVLLERSRKARRIVISVRPQKGVRVAIPPRTTFRQALEFVRLKKDWIIKHQARLEEAGKNVRPSPPPVDRALARRTLVARLHRLAKKHGYTFNRVFLRNQKTRWGSCSHHHNISLNVKLVRLPGELLDYVLLHELVHTRIPDHSKQFWAELERQVPGARALASRLRKVDLTAL